MDKKEEGSAGSSDDDEGDGPPSDDDGPPIMQMFPLDLRFSQRKTRSFFADGKVVEETANSIRAVRRSPEDAELYSAPWRLEAPFPAIEVIRWRCKLRDEATGRPVLNAAGKEVYEQEESWFTLDNRRLYCLQQAALKLWPERCTADARAEIRKDRRLREIRKFRTLDAGLSIMVGSRVDGVPFKRWAWKDEVTKMAKHPMPKGCGKGREAGRGSKGQASQGGVRDEAKGRGDKGGGRAKGSSPSTQEHEGGKGYGKQKDLSHNSAQTGYPSKGKGDKSKKGGKGGGPSACDEDDAGNAAQEGKAGKKGMAGSSKAKGKSKGKSAPKSKGAGHKGQSE